ncbi:hypothetical protein BVG16_14325 [Paenibacillus selenitireducens]|uniref:Uncharacterized protein n=1 Tax=Paenibacillus selenitireducens TaxID=1324314 RepID=A0A1T2XCR6_9BACL|nr:hypothetical protein [Paenibacillus selenitireducens]OPA77618.1 hypothetical protein BVG16_14325 [Paenibacillus selenitireducens]
MTGNIRWNFGFAIVGFVITFLLSIQHNLLTTSLLRSLYAFVIWFVIAYVIRFILAQLLASKQSEELSSSVPDEAALGKQLDLVVPDETEELHNLLKPKSGKEEAAAASEFKPLNPPKLVKVTEQDPEQMAKAIRHLTED